jgi:hypothetical protein
MYVCLLSMEVLHEHEKVIMLDGRTIESLFPEELSFFYHVIVPSIQHGCRHVIVQNCGFDVF